MLGWRVRLFVRAKEADAEIRWKQALLQALVTGKDGFDVVQRMFRRYQEALSPWMAAEREREERMLIEKAEQFARIPGLRVRRTRR